MKPDRAFLLLAMLLAGLSATQAIADRNSVHPPAQAGATAWGNALPDSVALPHGARETMQANPRL